MEDSDTMTYDKRSIYTDFNNFFSNLAESLLTKLLNPPGKFNLKSVLNFIIADNFCLNKTSEDKVLNTIKKIVISKAASIDRFLGHFLRDGAEVLSRPISEICNLSITRGVFPVACKVAKLKPFYKNRKKTASYNYRPISLIPVISKLIERIVQTNKFP